MLVRSTVHRRQRKLQGRFKCAGAVHQPNRRNIMAKGQARSNKETKKPKKEKTATVPAAGFMPVAKDGKK
jgi:hypothetical protein